MSHAAPDSPSLPAAGCDPVSRVHSWEMLFLLWVAFFLHQGDRQIFNSVLPLVRDSLGLTDVQVGLVGTIFTLVYGVMVPVAGFAGDLLSRKWIVFFSLLVFSAGTLFTGFCSGLLTLVIFRSVATGGGEAFFYPSATSLVAQFHHKTRALALGILQTALYVGITASGLIAGYIGQHYGWRSAFFTFGAAGIVWSAVVARRLQNPPMPGLSSAPHERVPLKEVLAYVASRPTVWLLSIAFGAMVYVNIAFLTWTPTFLHEKFGLSLAQAGFHSMFYHHLFAFFGVLAGAGFADRFAGRRRQVRFEVGMVGLLLGAPFIYWAAQAPSAAGCYAALSLFGLFRGFYDSNLFASLYEVIEPRFRASATGLMLCFAFVVGSLSPTVLGWMKSRAGLATGISSLAWFYLFGSVCIFLAIKFFLRRDQIPDAGISP